MIPDQWYVILESRQVKHGKPVGIARMGEKMVAWRDREGKVTVMSDLCPHRGAALSAGKLVDGCLQCPFHGFEFDPSGQCTYIPANGRVAEVPKAFQVKTYPTLESNDFIYIWWGAPREQYPALPWFDSLDHAAYSYHTLIDPWATHYSRAIENQLDVVHLPFVHHNSIGRGHRTLVNGPITRIEERPDGRMILDLWVYNEVDTGNTAKRPDEMPEPQRRPFLQFIFPNLWQNWIADKMRIVAAFVPVDDGNMLMYLRFYQNTVRLPLARQLYNRLGSLGNLFIERQDRRVVITQQPQRSDLKIGEKLIQGDRPIIEYRRLRRRLIEEVEQRQV